MASNQIADEARLSRLLIQRQILTEGQLKAATDYQRSLGGTLSDVLVKLGLLRQQQIEEFLGQPDGVGDTAQAAAASVATRDDALAPDLVPVEDLIVHRKLLAKLPVELVEKYLLVLFFPVGNLSQRRVILGYGRELPAALPEKVKSVLGVQIYTLPLNPEVALSFLHETGRSHAKGGERVLSAGPSAAKEPSAEEPRKKTPAGAKGESTSLMRQAGGDAGGMESRAAPAAPAAPATHASTAQTHGPAVPADLVLQALLSLLAKKGLATREELEVEIELARIRQRAVHPPPAAPPQGR